MKRKLSVIALTAALSTTLLLGGCGVSKSSRDSGQEMAMDQAATNSSSDMSAEAGTDSAQSDQAEMKELAAKDDAADMDAADGGSTASGLKSTIDAASKNQTQKLIFTYNYSVEAKEFDSFYEKITKKTSETGGYVESSETNGSASDGSRYASLTLRIPANKMNQMLSLLDSDSNITYQSSSSENVTLRYIDMESHLKALRTEQETLLQLLEKADKLKDVIALQSQLTQIRYEIESYESQLRSYDNLIDYSTLYLNITEVERTTNTASTKTPFFEEAGNRLSDNIYALGQGIRAFAIWIIGSLPVLAPLAVVIVCALLFVKRNKKKQKQENSAVSDTEQQDTDS